MLLLHCLSNAKKLPFLDDPRHIGQFAPPGPFKNVNMILRIFKSSSSIDLASHGPMPIPNFGLELDKAWKQDQQPVQMAALPDQVYPRSRICTPRGEVKALVFRA